MKAKIDFSKLPPKKGGRTVRELAEFFRATHTTISTKISAITTGRVPGFTVERIRTDDRFIITQKTKRKKGK